MSQGGSPLATSSLTPAERSIRGTIAVHESWANTPDRTKRSQPGRDAFRQSFEDKVDPDRKLDPAERAKRAESAYKAHFARMAFKSMKARRAKKTGTK